MDRKTLASKVYQTCHLTGSFILRSGQHSHEYFDKYRLESDPLLLSAIADQMLHLIPPNTEVLAGLEMGGIPVATALSLKSGIPTCFVRKQAKNYGTCQLAEGAHIKNKNVLIIEDVITSGGQVLLSTQDLRSHGAHISTVLCVIQRGNEESLQRLKQVGLETRSLFKRSDFPN
jgi:orotate phosphoribosyltransferase